MTFQVNRRAVGVDDILGAKSWPRVPGEMADTLVGVYDMTDAFNYARRFGGIGNFFNSAGTANEQANTMFNIPPNEAWYVDNLSISGGSALAAGITCRAVIAANEIGYGDLAVYPVGYAQWVGEYSPTFNPGETIRWGVSPRRWFGPGTQFGYSLKGVALVPLQIAGAWSGARVLV